MAAGLFIILLATLLLGALAKIAILEKRIRRLIRDRG